MTSKSIAQLTTEVNSNIPDNTTGQITPAVMRQTLIDIINSYFNLPDGPVASNSQFGVVKPDGTTITSVAGVISVAGGGVSSVTNSDGTLVISPTSGAVSARAAVATPSTKGVVQPDNSTITISGGVISAVGGGGGGGSNLINLATAYGLVADGYLPAPTDNANGFLNMMGVNDSMGTGLVRGIKTINPVYGPPIPVTINTGTGVVTAYSNATRTTPVPHFLRVTDPVVFFVGAGGVMPGGVTSMTPVYAAFSSMSESSFKVTTIDPFALFCSGIISGPQPATVTFTGSPSNVYMATVNAGWLNYWLPAGSYYSTGILRLAGPRKFRVYMDGVNIVGPSGGMAIGFSGTGLEGGFFPFTGYAINSVAPGSSTITLKSAGDAAHFTVGGLFGIGCCDTQNSLAVAGFGVTNAGVVTTPSNLYFFEVQRVKSIVGAVITLGNPTGINVTRHGYLDTYPEYVRIPFASATSIPAGPAYAYPIAPASDAEVHIIGFTNNDFFQTTVGGRRVKLEDFKINGEALNISSCEDIECVRGTTGAGICQDGSGWRTSDQPTLLFDKLNGRATFYQCEAFTVETEGSGPDLVRYRDSPLHSIGGTGKHVLIDGCDVTQSVTLGPEGFGGGAETVSFGGANRIGSLSIPTRFDATAPSYGNQCVSWTFSGGLLTAPLSLSKYQMQSWMITGKRGFITDANGQFPYMGADFLIANVYGSQQSQNTTATIGPPSPPTLGDATVSWAGHPCANGDTIVLPQPPGESLPSGGQLLPVFQYFVVQSAANSFKLAQYVNGDPVQVSGNAVTGTVNRNPNINMSTSLPSIPAGSSASHTVTISVASPSVFDWGVAAPANSTPITLRTTGVFPATDLVRLTGTMTLSGNTVTVTGSSGGVPFFPLNIVNAGVSAGTQITGQKSGTPGGDGVYFINNSQSVGPATMTFNDPLRPDAFMYYTANGAANHFNLQDAFAAPVNIVKAGTGTHTATSNPLRFAPNMCPSLTVHGGTGDQMYEDARNAPTQGRPFLTFGSRAMLGQMPSNPNLIPTNIKVQGKLKTLTINVVVADTSGGGAKTLEITALGFDSTLAPSNLDETINLATTGVRTVTATTTSGGVAGDTLVAYAGTISQQVKFTTNPGGGSQPIASYAQVLVSVETDQGIWATPSVVNLSDPTWGGTVLTMVDSDMPALGSNVAGI